MTVALTKRMQHYIKRIVDRGEYDSPEAVVEAALAIMKRQESALSFDAGELDRLLAEGETSIRRQGTLDFEAARALRHRARARAGKARK